MNVTCPKSMCQTIVSSACVFYEGPSLLYTGIRTNDSIEIVLQKLEDLLSQGSNGVTYFDQLIDTPTSKVGNALKLVRVDALEEKLEYVDVATIEDKFFQFVQASPSNTWNINHNLEKFPSVTVVDSGNTEVEGDIVHIDNNNLTIIFSNPFSGKAFLN